MAHCDLEGGEGRGKDRREKHGVGLEDGVEEGGVWEGEDQGQCVRGRMYGDN